MLAALLKMSEPTGSLTSWIAKSKQGEFHLELQENDKSFLEAL